jgi:N-methylhydantoinase A
MTDAMSRGALPKRVRIGVDVGGTFTDFVLVDEAHDVIYTGKRLTTPSDPSAAILAGLERLLRDAGIRMENLHGIVHGTTLVTNTIIERTGARVGLITTRGFRDSLEIGKEIRYDLYDLHLERPEPLVPRRMRLEVDERIDAEGAVLRPLDTNGLLGAARELIDAGAQAVAICFIHAYRNPAHERLAKETLGDAFPGLRVSVSSEVAPEIREFERVSTTTANAYVQPLIERYLARLEDELRRMKLGGRLYVMLSGGGITTVRAASDFPIRLIESGPAAGAMAASYYGLLTGTEHLISFDMGGTTAKISLIDRGWPERVHEFEAGRVRRFRRGSGLPIKVPVVEMIEIGAGGGSLAHVDPMGLLKVGPQSAGSEPGPVCYARGGTRPTVTDADLFLGYLSPDYFLGGEMPLDLDSVRRAIDEHIARPLGLSLEEAAIGIHNVVNENMAAAARMHAAEKGRDPRRYGLIAFGGAGPVHAYGLAKLLKLKRVICPFGAGVTSALGLLVAAPAIDLVRSYVARVEHIDWSHLTTLFTEMEADARALLLETGASPAEVTIDRTADMRYVGQGFEINVPLPHGALSAGSTDEIRQRFFDAYRELFERSATDVPVEALSWRLAATAPVPNIQLRFGGQPPAMADARKGTRNVYFPGVGVASCEVYDRYSLARGTEIRGPAVIEERESTIVVGPDGHATVDANLNVIIDIEQQGTSPVNDA